MLKTMWGDSAWKDSHCYYSTCDLPANLVEEYDIHVLPLRIIYKDREYRDHVEITPEDVYNRLEIEVLLLRPTAMSKSSLQN